MISVIHNAKDTPIDQLGAPGSPNVRAVLDGIMGALAFAVITTKQDHVTKEIIEVARPVVTRGSVQPLKLRELELKPEGMRSWEWFKIFTTPDVLLKTNDVISIGAKRYRVMGDKNWASNGYMYYEVVNAYGHGRS
jgi:hypothetical protein